MTSSFLFSRTIDVSKQAFSLFTNTEFSISKKIQDGIAMLKASPPLAYSGSRQQVALAILNKQTGEIQEERIWITPGGDLISSSLPIRIQWWNSFNTYYEIDDRPELIVVANKFLVERKYLPEQTTLRLDLDAPRSKYTDMVYAPYSENLHWPDVVDDGKEYINRHAEQAFKELKTAKVQSRSQPGKLVVDVVPKDLVKTIVLVEHVDPGWLEFSDDGGRALVERALVIIGANQQWAYRYTSSKANAYGLAQFIEPTYDLMVDRYPDAGLIKDHTLGMVDHTNAFKAIALLFDNEAHEIQSKASIPATREMLAAAYNGGPGRVIQAVKSDGQDWANSDIFPDETSNYVKKYGLIKKLNIF
ncbi:MAG: transglycosylase SLT domain-containing protein [Patescibacteria group bacterium]